MRALFVSFVAHVTLAGAILVITALAPDTFPSPRRAIVYAEPRLIKLADVELPAARPRPRTRTSPGNSGPSAAIMQPAPIAAAPIVAPDGFTAETGREGIAAGRQSAVSAIERGGTAGVDFGTSVAPPAPPPPRTPIRLHQGIQSPRKIVDVAPSYPEPARRAGVSGVVIIEATIDEHGSVTSAHVLRSLPLLDQAAVDAVKGWRFSPALLNGEPVPVVMTVTVNFQLR